MRRRDRDDGVEFDFRWGQDEMRTLDTDGVYQGVSFCSAPFRDVSWC